MWSCLHNPVSLLVSFPSDLHKRKEKPAGFLVISHTHASPESHHGDRCLPCAEVL